MYTLDLQWREFSLNLTNVKTWLDANIVTANAGLSANTCLQIHFESEPSEQEKTDIQTYWDGLTAQSAEVQSYESQATLEAARLAKKASAEAKLIALGLTTDEVKAILG